VTCGTADGALGGGFGGRLPGNEGGIDTDDPLRGVGTVTNPGGWLAGGGGTFDSLIGGGGGVPETGGGLGAGSGGIRLGSLTGGGG
jgi:hypothetical protein